MATPLAAMALAQRCLNMHETITYRTNTATVEEIRTHLAACDASFIPPLSTRVNIADYAEKLSAKAQRLEAWDNGKLIGLAAIYANEQPRAFLTNLSILPDYQRQGIAVVLLEKCNKSTFGAGFALLALEVATANTAAIALYRAHGFVVNEKNDAMLTMQKTIEREK